MLLTAFHSSSRELSPATAVSKERNPPTLPLLESGETEERGGVELAGVDLPLSPRLLVWLYFPSGLNSLPFELGEESWIEKFP